MKEERKEEGRARRGGGVGAVMAMASGMLELGARCGWGGLWRMDGWGGGVKCSRGGVEPSLEPVAASLSV